MNLLLIQARLVSLAGRHFRPVAASQISPSPAPGIPRRAESSFGYQALHTRRSNGFRAASPRSGADDLGYPLECIKVLAERGEACPHGVDAHVADTGVSPDGNVLGHLRCPLA